MPAPLLPSENLDFTGLTRADILVRLQQLFNQQNPEWDDFSTAHPENLLLEGMSMVADLIRGSMEERVRQLTYSTVTDYLATQRLARINDYNLRAASAAEVTIDIVTKNGAGVVARLALPAGMIIRTVEDGITKRYRLKSEVVFTAGESTKSGIVFEQAEVIQGAFESLSEPNMELVFDQGIYVEGSMDIQAGNGPYKSTNTFVGAGSADRLYRVYMDRVFQPRIRFGNGINGEIPTGGISSSYKVTLGVDGEVTIGATWTADATILDDVGNTVFLAFTNASASSVATDPMTVDEARVLGPLSMRTVGSPLRLVADYDFEYAGLNTPGVARAFLATSNHEATIAEDVGDLLLVGFGNKLASGKFSPVAPVATKIAEVQTNLSSVGGSYIVQGFIVTAKAAELTPITITARLNGDGTVSPGDMASNVRAALFDLFAVANADRTPNDSVDFGARLLDSSGLPNYLIEWSKVFGAVLSATGVRSITPANNDILINGSHSSLSLAPLAFPNLTSVILHDMDNGGAQI